MSKKDEKSQRPGDFITPRYWLVWFGIGLLRLISMLPVSIIWLLGKGLGILIYRIVPSRRRAARINLKQAYPDYSDEQIDQLNKKAFRNLGISMLEMGVAWFKPTPYLKSRCQIEGLEHLDTAMKKNKGVILLTGHFTTLEIGSRLIGFYADKYNGVYKKAHDPLFNAIMVKYRSRFGDQLIENKDTRAIIRGLKNGHATWFAPDQDFANQDIVFTPFLGGIASTLTATAKLAKLTGAAVVPFYQVRLDKGEGYKLIVLPPLEDFPSEDIETDSARVNKAIEDMVYACPEQYLWSHKRFKTQPDRTTNIYA